MSADLETAIRGALHAGDITAADLRHPVLRERRRFPSRPVVAIASAMAAVVVLAVALAVVAGRGGDHPAAGRNGSLAGVVGHRWRVVGLTDPAGHLRVPVSLHAQVGFTRDGYVLGDDTLNALQANYRATADGYTVRNFASSAVGSAGLPPQRARTVSAVDAMFTGSGEPGGTTPAQATVGVSVHGATLTLRRGPVTLTLHRSGSQPDFFAQRPSRTTTASG